jgi:hypothetical protein
VSDLHLNGILDDLETLLQSDEVDGEAIAAWRQRFDAAVATAERGPGWPEIVTRSRTLATRLDQAADRLSLERDRIRRELELQGQGARALKGYKPS